MENMNELHPVEMAWDNTTKGSRLRKCVAHACLLLECYVRKKQQKLFFFFLDKTTVTLRSLLQHLVLSLANTALPFFTSELCLLPSPFIIVCLFACQLFLIPSRLAKDGGGRELWLLCRLLNIQCLFHSVVHSRLAVHICECIQINWNGNKI